MKKFYFSKKIQLLLASLCIVALFVSSCVDDAAPRYSCDDYVDQWVKDNFLKLESLKWSELQNLPECLRRPAYAAIEKTNKVALWIDKTEDLKKSLVWTDAEKKHLDKIPEFVTSHTELFSDANPTEDDLSELEIYFYKWTEEAKKEFNWSDRLCSTILCSLENPIDKNGTLPSFDTPNKVGDFSGGIGGIEIRTPTCNCNTTSDWCSGLEDTCKDSQCYNVRFCGTLLLYECNGRCAY